MKISSKLVSQEMKDKFTGGRGFDLWLLWNALPKNRLIKWDDPKNEVCISCGPLGGIPVFPGSGKSIVVAISPLTDTVVDSNVARANRRATAQIKRTRKRKQENNGLFRGVRFRL